MWPSADALHVVYYRLQGGAHDQQRQWHENACVQRDRLQQVPITDKRRLEGDIVISAGYYLHTQATWREPGRRYKIVFSALSQRCGGIVQPTRQYQLRLSSLKGVWRHSSFQVMECILLT